MNPSIRIAVAALLLGAASFSQAQGQKPQPLPSPPPPVKQSLPLNAQPNNGGVYVPVSKDGNVGVSVEPLRHPVSPTEKGGSVGITIKTP